MTARPAETRRPAKIEGLAPGSSSCVSRCNRENLAIVNRSCSALVTERKPNKVLLAIGKNAISTVTNTRAPNDGPATRTMMGVSTMMGVTWRAISQGHRALSSARDIFMRMPSDSPVIRAKTKPTKAVLAEIYVADKIWSTVARLSPSNNLWGGGIISAEPSPEAKLLSSV